MTTRRMALSSAVVAVVACLAYVAWGTPDLTSPPAAWTTFARDWIRNVLPLLYWSGAIVLLWTWAVLRWQRRDGETSAARWNRRRELVLGLLFLTLATSETVLRDWRIVAFAVGVTLTILAFVALGVAYVWTYARPVWLCRGGRCEVVPEPVDGGVLPKPPEVWDGVKERRVGPPDRRRRRVVS